jgi:hypothetical protein
VGKPLGFGENAGGAAPCAALPSGQAAYALMHGDPGALLRVLGYTAFRALLIGAGLFAFGNREHLVRNSIAGALGVEAYVLWWASRQNPEPAHA